MKKEELLKMFKDANPELVELNPIITVEEISEMIVGSKGHTESLEYNPPLLQIDVKHPFVFDNRLIPKEFQGIEVRNIIVGKLPKEFEEPEIEETPLEEYYSPEKYVQFVNRAIYKIRKKLKNPKLTKEEALDALTFA